MLIITRKEGDSLVINCGDEQIEITVTEVGKQVRLGIDAPAHFKIWRKELLQTIEENQQAISDADGQSIRSILQQLNPR